MALAHLTRPSRIAFVLVASLLISVLGAIGSMRASAVGPYPDYTPPRQTNLTSCPAVAVVGFRGSGEAFDDGTLGLGGSVNAFASQLTSRIGSGTLGTSAVSYPAIPFLVGQDQWLSRPDLLLASLLNVSNMLLPAGYSDSAATGANDGASDITHLAVRCPTTKIVVSGFSQGADAAKRALALLNTTTAARVAAVVLMGDSTFTTSEPGVEVTGGTAGAPGTGIARTFFPSGVVALQARYFGRVLSACHDNDPICRGTNINLSVGFGGHGYVADAANLASWTARVLSPPASPSPAPPTPNDCVAFVSDVTIPDNTRVAAGASFTKTWKLRNCGNTNWSGMRAVRTSGGYGPGAFDVPALAPGGVANISVAVTAPTASGTARATYQLRRDNTGLYAAGSFWVQILVPSSAPHNCEAFVSDVTIPDGTAVSPRQAFTKTWRLNNCGNTDWSGLTAVRVLGDFGPLSFPVPTVAPGGSVDVSAIFAAPDSAGTHRASYRLQAADGSYADHIFWVDVTVLAAPRPGRDGVTSYDRMTSGAPFHGYFTNAWQSFIARSNRITYLGVTVGNPGLPAGPVSANVLIRLCADPNCAGVMAQASPQINNYGNSAADIGDVAVTPGGTYYIVWYQPPAVAGNTWVTYWWSGGASIGQSDQMQALVRGYDQAPIGDINGDGYVGCADKAILLADFGKQPATAADGDINGDGIVNIFDLSVLLSHWAPAPGDSC